MNKKGFTLIELLAVIVVLAIIALIATPMILNVVEKSKKGAAKSSALGYIDAVEKQIMVNQLNADPDILDGEYNLPIDNKYKVLVKGSQPSSGNMTITKSKVTSATMCINNYTVTYDGKIATLGSKCNSTEESSSSTIPTIDSCPGCVYAFTKEKWYYTGENQTKLTSEQYKKNYMDVVNESGKPYFLGLKLNSLGFIEKAYACGIDGAEVFCVQGSTDGSSFDNNREIIKSTTIYSSGCDYDTGLDCKGNIEVRAYDNGLVQQLIAGNGVCQVDNSGKLFCFTS